MFNNQKKHSSDSVGKTLENNKQNKNMKVNSHRNHIRWEKLDNTAHHHRAERENSAGRAAEGSEYRASEI